MTEANRKLALRRLLTLEFAFDVVTRAGLKHQAARVLSLPIPSWGNTKTLEDRIPVVAILDQGQTQNVIPEEETDEGDPEI